MQLPQNIFNLTTRTCTIEDREFCFSLVKTSLWKYVAEYFPPTKAFFDEDFDNHYKDIIILEQDTSPIGYFMLREEPEGLHVVKIFLAEDMRRKGIGTFLMKYFETLTNHNRLFLSVWDNNPAVAFYKKLGYKEIARNNHKLKMEKHI
jgi:ribosomal protein S18 acetylase RimI-like enzyme